MMPDILIRPANPIYSGVARIRITVSEVSVFVPDKHDTFRDVVRSLGYKWDGDVWTKSAKPEKVLDAAAELGHELLSAGFWVAPPMGTVRDLIIKETFEREPRRKILRVASGLRKGWFAIQWPRSDNLYDAAKRIGGSRYSSPSVVVPPEFYDEVIDFAEVYDFWISPAAQEVIDQARAALNAALLVDFAPRHLEDDALDLEIPSDDIDPELLDDDLADEN